MAHAAVAAPPVYAPEAEVAQGLNRSKVEQELGRRLKFKERIALAILSAKVKRKARKSLHKRAKHPPSDNFALLSFIFGLATFLFSLFGLLGFIFGVIALIRIFRKPDERGGKAFAIIGLLIGLPVFAWLVGVVFFGLDIDVLFLLYH